MILMLKNPNISSTSNLMTKLFKQGSTSDLMFMNALKLLEKSFKLWCSLQAINLMLMLCLTLLILIMNCLTIDCTEIHAIVHLKMCISKT